LDKARLVQWAAVDQGARGQGARVGERGNDLQLARTVSLHSRMFKREDIASGDEIDTRKACTRHTA